MSSDFAEKTYLTLLVSLKRELWQQRIMSGENGLENNTQKSHEGGKENGKQVGG